MLSFQIIPFYFISSFFFFFFFLMFNKDATEAARPTRYDIP